MLAFVADGKPRGYWEVYFKKTGNRVLVEGHAFATFASYLESEASKDGGLGVWHMLRQEIIDWNDQVEAGLEEGSFVNRPIAFTTWDAETGGAYSYRSPTSKQTIKDLHACFAPYPSIRLAGEQVWLPSWGTLHAAAVSGVDAVEYLRARQKESKSSSKSGKKILVQLQQDTEASKKQRGSHNAPGALQPGL